MDFKRHFNIGTTKDGRIFVTVTFVGGKLSLSGVIGPLESGNSRGGCGQIDMGFAHRNTADDDRRYESLTLPSEISFHRGWDAEKWFNLLDIWKQWHLNDMRPGCEHQRDWGNRELEVVHYGLTHEAYILRERALEKAQRAGLTGEVAELTDTERALAEMEDWFRGRFQLPAEDSPLFGCLYEQRRERKLSGWVYPREHPDGVLGKPCPVCGYEYGTAWQREEVPQEVLSWLLSMPENSDGLPACWKRD